MVDSEGPHGAAQRVKDSHLALEQGGDDAYAARIAQCPEQLRDLGRRVLIDFPRLMVALSLCTSVEGIQTFNWLFPGRKSRRAVKARSLAGPSEEDPLEDGPGLQ